MTPAGNGMETAPGTRVQYDVLLTVTGEETYADGHMDRTRTVSRAVCEISGALNESGIASDEKSGAGNTAGGVRVFRYRETDPEGGVTRSVIRFADGCCSIIRTGVISAEMRFVPDEQTHCVYDTPYGSIPMTICTQLVAVRRIGSNFHARIRYRLLPEGADPVECAVTIKAEPCD